MRFAAVAVVGAVAAAVAAMSLLLVADVALMQHAENTPTHNRHQLP